MAIKEPGHGLIMIRRVRAHDRGLSVHVCEGYEYRNIKLRDVRMRVLPAYQCVDISLFIKQMGKVSDMSAYVEGV